MDPDSIVKWVLEGYRTVAISDDEESPGGSGGGWGAILDMTFTFCTLHQQYSSSQYAMPSIVSLRIKFRLSRDVSLCSSRMARAGDKWLEIDTRFSYCALLTLSILPGIDLEEAVDLAAANAFVASCQNFDGGYGCVPGAEWHAGRSFAVLLHCP